MNGELVRVVYGVRRQVRWSVEPGATVVRAFELPLHYADAGAWQLIRQCWREARRLANWCQTEMLRQDDPEQPKPPEFDLYARAFGRERESRGRKNKEKVLPARAGKFPGGEFFKGAMKSASTIIENVHANYKRDRPDVLVRNLRSWRNYRSVPWPVHADMVKRVWLDGNGRPCLALTLPGGDVELRMRNGREFGRQMGHFRDLIRRFEAGERAKEVVLREKKCRGGDVMVKMVAELTALEKTGSQTLTLISTPESFWVAELDGRQAWVLNADHVRRTAARHAEHLRALDRLRQDGKAEARLASSRAWQQQTRLDILCEKDRNRLASFIHEASCQLADFARRQRIGEVVYDDHCREFSPKFPWRQLRDRLKAQLTYRGIVLREIPKVSDEPHNQGD